ncbi:MAG: hypothetical protein JWO38_3620 [Gemmataceae bacterium]|nr:hypothetical protein [Gemmataceae bacterium]
MNLASAAVLDRAAQLRAESPVLIDKAMDATLRAARGIVEQTIRSHTAARPAFESCPGRSFPSQWAPDESRSQAAGNDVNSRAGL